LKYIKGKGFFCKMVRGGRVLYRIEKSGGGLAKVPPFFLLGAEQRRGPCAPVAGARGLWGSAAAVGRGKREGRPWGVYSPPRFGLGCGEAEAPQRSAGGGRRRSGGHVVGRDGGQGVGKEGEKEEEIPVAPYVGPGQREEAGCSVRGGAGAAS
jgi:hypothetical protein